jgi:transitional endoplasmic reticulum ATPase
MVDIEDYVVGEVGRVRFSEMDNRRLYIELRSGRFARIDSRQPIEVDSGSTVILSEDGQFEIVPEEIWPELPWVGVVRLRLEDITIVEVRGLPWKQVKTRVDIPYQVGNTVEGKDSIGVTRVLSESAIDLPLVDASVVDKYRVNPNSIREQFDDFGGLIEVVRRARELIEVPLMHEKEFANVGARPVKGILFTGLPGTGKTMLARILAKNTEAVFYQISGPEIFSKWYGQTEEVLRKIFEDASSQKKAIVFFDEIDSVAGKRVDESHEASRRVVAQLLTLMDGFASSNKVVVIAATNRPQDIDPALLRPGRFDLEIKFPLPLEEDRELILEASARKLNTSENLPHKTIANRTKSWSAADLTAIWSEAALLAVVDGRDIIIAEDYVGAFERVRKHRIAGMGDSKDERA